ncbi:MAG: hypothetical protein WBR15_02175 [Gammaproteobacteria bacterium]
MTKYFEIVILLLAMGVAGCSTLACGDPHPYLNSAAHPALQAPPGLSVPSPDPTYEIQSITPNLAKPTGRDASGVCLINPPQLIRAQPAATPKPATTGPKSGPVPSSPGGSQPAAKPAGENKTQAPVSGTTVPPPVATQERMR